MIKGSDEYTYSSVIVIWILDRRVSLLLTPLCCDDTHDIMPRVSALAGCDGLVSEPGYREVVTSPPSRKKFRSGIVVPTGLKRYTNLAIGLRMKLTHRKCRMNIDLYPYRVKEKLNMRKVKGKWIMKKKMGMISKDGTISEFPGYTSSKEEEEEEDEEEEKEASEKKRSNEA
ncbi:hypothetical protein Tco_1241316 [Tanacetum coccineum]